MSDEETLNLLREIRTMMCEIKREIVPSYPGADSFGQNREGEELTLRKGLIERTTK